MDEPTPGPSLDSVLLGPLGQASDDRFLEAIADTLASLRHPIETEHLGSLDPYRVDYAVRRLRDIAGAYRASAAPPPGEPSEESELIRAKIDSWWIAAIGQESLFVLRRIRQRVEAYASGSAPPGAGQPTEEER